MSSNSPHYFRITEETELKTEFDRQMWSHKTHRKEYEDMEDEVLMYQILFIVFLVIAVGLLLAIVGFVIRAHMNGRKVGQSAGPTATEIRVKQSGKKDGQGSSLHKEGSRDQHNGQART